MEATAANTDSSETHLGRDDNREETLRNSTEDFVTKSGIRVSICKKDITRFQVDAVVNAANKNLAHGRGVAAAISDAAGNTLREEGDKYIQRHGALQVTQVVETTGGLLQCRKVLHAVGPRWSDYEDKALCQQHLIDTVFNCLNKATTLGLSSIAIPSISSANFAVPQNICADSYLIAVQAFDEQHGGQTSLKNVYFVDVSDVMVDLVQRTFAENWNNPSVSAYIDPSAQLDQHASAGPATSRRRNPNVRPPSSLKEQPHHRPEDLLRRSGRSRAMTEKGFKDVLRTRIDNFNQAIKSIKRLIQSTVSVLNDKHDDVVFLRQVQTKLVKKMSEIRTLQARIEELRSDPRTVEALEEIETQAATLVSQLVVEIARNNPPSGRLGRPSTNSGRRKGGSDISHSTHSRIQRTEQESIKVKMEMQVLQLKTEAQLEREEEEAEASLRALQEEQEHRESERRKEKRRREFEEAEAQEEDKRRIERIRQKLVDSKRKAERQSFFEERKLLVIQAANNDAMNALVANSRSSESSMTIFSEYEMEDPTPDLSRKQRSTADWVQSTVDQLSTTEKKLPLSPLVKQGKSRQVLQVDRSSNQQEVRATDGTTAATEKTDDHSRDQHPGLSARDGTFVPFSNITTTTKKVLPEIVRRQPTQTATGVQHHFTEAAYTTASLNPSYGGIPAIRERQLTKTQSVPRPPFTQSTWTGVSTTTANVGGYVNAATTYYAEPHQPRVLATSEAVGGHVNAAATYYAEPHQPRVLATSEAVGGHVNAAAAYNAEPYQPHGLTTSAGVGSYVDYYMAKNYEPPQKDSPQQSKLRHDAPIFTQVAAGQQYDTAHSDEARHVIYGNSEAEPPVVTLHPRRSSYTSEQMNFTNASGEDQLRMITQTFANAMTLSRLPTQEPSIFVGDPLDYPSWHAAFKFLIGSQNIQETEKLLYLKRFLGGSALESISGFFLMRKPEAFTSAMKMLEARYGNSFAIGQAFRTKLENWDTVRSEDPVALRLFSDFLRQCSVAQNEIGGLHILDDAQYLKRMVDKLPKYIKNRWSRKVTHDKVKHPERYPTFKELSDFVEEEAEISNEPVFGMIANKAAPKFDPVDAQKQQLYRRDKGLRQNRLESGAQSVSNHLLNSVQPTANDLASGGQPTDKSPCMYCEMSNHELPSCRKFAGLSKEDKRGYVMRNRLCFGCLKAAGHVASQCKEREVCSKCKKNHPTSMHLDTFQHESFGSPRETNQSVSYSIGNTESSSDKMLAQLHSNKQVPVTTRATLKTNNEGGESMTSMIVPVFMSLISEPTKEVLVYAMLDTMSNATFVTDSCAKELGASSKNATLRLTTLSEKDALVPCRRYEGLQVRAYNRNEYVTLPPSFSRETLKTDMSEIPTRETAESHTHLHHLSSNMQPALECPVGLLIGYNCPEALVPTDTVEGFPYAVETPLGWSIVGTTRAATIFNDTESSDCKQVTQDMQKQSTNVFKARVKEVSATELVQVLERDFSDMESGTISQDDMKFMNIVEQNVKVNAAGHYEMPLPFRHEHPSMADNRNVILRRTFGLRRQFEKRPAYKKDYVEFMKEIIERGDAERVPTDELERVPRWYIPHHGVYHPKKPDKIRVVFDCSASFQGSCLNEELLQGPDLINSLTGVLQRFRKGSIAFSCDIEKMYHQFHVDPADRDYLRFLWWENGDETGPLVDYRMKVHIFGATSSPGCANFGLKQVAKDHRNISEDASKFLQRDFYVDDGLHANESVENAREILDKAREICTHGKLRLHKIMSNSPDLLSHFPESEVARKKVTDLSSVSPTPAVGRTLGLQWDMEEDIFSFNCLPKEAPETRRGVLSTIASLYDPLGFLGPFILKGRLVLQEMCGDGLDWDDPLPNQLAARWKAWLDDFSNLRNIGIPRSFLPSTFGVVKEVELHHFSDASEKGYGQCSYLRFLNTNDEYHSTLVMAKSRVAPLRAVTIPRKELQAAVLSARMSRFLQEELHYKGLRHYFWTDSQIVLAYLNNQSKRFHVFVANRIQQILEASTADQWRYVPSNDNPADHASRGLTVNELKSTEWFSGPAFLRQALPEPTEAEFSIPDDDVEVKRAMTTSAADVKTSTWEERFKRFSTKRSLIRAIALLMRHCHKYEAKTPANSSLVEHSLTRLESYRVADLKVVKISQQEHFASPSREDKSSLKDLDCYKDENEMLRVGGRIDRSAETNELRHPVVLPHQSHLAVLVARACHAQIAHQGRPFTINEIRRQGFWILGMRRVVLAVIRHCTVCIRHRGRPEAQKMAELPEERVNESAPFTHCGVDCFGPFHVKDGRKEVKRYGLLITCLSSRAVHIEVLDDLSTDSFINGLRVLMALRGNVRSIRCDRGTNFVGANNELKAAWKGMNQEAIVTRLLKDSCEFLFNPPTASHMGGLWERQIRTVRSVLSGLLDRYGQRLTSSTLRTFMYEAMAIVNSRPLCVESLESPDGPLPLTPNHLLTMKPAGVLPPPGNFSDADVYARKRWRCVQHLADEFWRRWRREYLASLQLRQKWLSPMPNVKVGDVVLLHDDTAPRAEWSLARVTEVFPSRDGLVRSVKVLLAATLDARGRPIAPASVLTRPVHKLTVWVRDRDAEQRQ